MKKKDQKDSIKGRINFFFFQTKNSRSVKTD